MIVVDASVAVAWLFENERSDASELALSRAGAEGAIVPSLWRLEIVNVLRTAVRRWRCDEAYAEVSLGLLSRLPIATDEETDRHAWYETRKLSRDEALTSYDAAYPELAIRRRLPLASSDQALVAAARRRDVAVITA